MENTYSVQGMTCNHCVHAVTEEVSAIPGVDAVQVSLEKSSMVVESAQPIDYEAIKAAVSEAGDYTVQPAA